ncbi:MULTISPECIES: DUF6913 domain-containing protein [Butyricimonas]|uniref:DUF6913 domain-containing protein n=1 Tax=Butyricimonas TaxID=574697 RepID=UPI001D08BE43|nr:MULTISPECIES: hypothetical protein [Butyricimonas]MCB6973452.1 hypothetical protein [Butyricimonas synergistica]MCG4520077.1 hypothetical protein [Butyricimonas sp. DFI.6.44]
MLKFIVEKFKRYHLKDVAVKDERVLAFQNLEAAKECVLFWVADDISWTEVDKIRKSLAKYMEVHLLSFIRQSKSVFERSGDALYADESSITYGGKIRDAKLREVLKKTEGVFIDISMQPDVLGDYIVRYAKSPCKVGISREGVEHDIMFANVRNTDVFVDRLFKLFTKINTY